MKNYVYICSPLRGDFEKNIENAIAYCRAAFRLGYIPIAPHIYFTQFVDDENDAERKIAMRTGAEMLLACSEVWVFGLNDPSEGMLEEIALARKHGIPVKDGMEMIWKNTMEIRLKPETSRAEIEALIKAIGDAPAHITIEEGKQYDITFCDYGIGDWSGGRHGSVGRVQRDAFKQQKQEGRRWRILI